jgi:hypothetical protein
MPSIVQMLGAATFTTRTSFFNLLQPVRVQFHELRTLSLRICVKPAHTQLIQEPRMLSLAPLCQASPYPARPRAPYAVACDSTSTSLSQCLLFRLISHVSNSESPSQRSQHICSHSLR